MTGLVFPVSIHQNIQSTTRVHIHNNNQTVIFPNNLERNNQNDYVLRLR